MLVLTRRQNETIVVTFDEPIPAGTEVKITLLGSLNGKATLGFTAPREVKVMRAELAKGARVA